MYYVYVTSWENDELADTWLAAVDIQFSTCLGMAKPFPTWEDADKAAKQAKAIEYTVLKA